MPEGAKLQGWGGVVSSKVVRGSQAGNEMNGESFLRIACPTYAYEIEIEIKLGPSETRDATKIIFFLPGVPPAIKQSMIHPETESLGSLHRSVTVRAGSGNFSEWGVTG